MYGSSLPQIARIEIACIGRTIGHVPSGAEDSLAPVLDAAFKCHDDASCGDDILVTCRRHGVTCLSLDCVLEMSVDSY